MIAQIRAGLWVRNGFPIHLLILQSSLIILDPNTIIVSILNRFGLLSFFCGEVENRPYEGVHLLSMVEELLYVLMTILGERASATKFPFQRAIRHLECILKDVLSHFHAPGSTLTTAYYPANKWHPLAHHEVNPQASTQLLVLQGEENDPIVRLHADFGTIFVANPYRAGPLSLGSSALDHPLSRSFGSWSTRSFQSTPSLTQMHL
ncbi:uncharacterized protein F5891DRAFT_1207685 [Suillus fuscotomentosus]|uniref:E3 ubiquitin-protein ligase n=1 Tax=Suillus fuscotomentosus TaxID=1912939 RepID=A0AAD4DSU7_9AGAM|nr:uncharacterized protein F5891DRAFT_1207685 [Suillus fuscotomentosus]KAG1893305.1 hypothetical protein F5891DRAFT_1207685 [Suillus fuscotomentosus]